MRLVALISGSGTTLQNLIDQGFDIACVVASKPGILGLERAQRAGIPTVVIASLPRDTFSERVFAEVRRWQPDLVCLCGWLKLLQIPEDFANRVLNIHPSLLPQFGGQGMYGRHVHEAVLASGVKESGCTVHYADNSYDTGPILVQKRVPVLTGDTPESLAARVFTAECEAYPEAIRKLMFTKTHSTISNSKT